MDTKDALNKFLNTLEEIKAENIVTIDLQGKSLIADHFIIATAKNDRHAQAIVNAFVDEIKFGKRKTLKSSASDSSPGWRILDDSGIIVHIFLEEFRKKYDLEALWNREFERQKKENELS